MDIINKVLISTLILLVLGLIVSLAQASGGLHITHLDVSHDMVTYEGFIEIERTGDVTADYLVIVLVDEKSVLTESVEWPGHKYRVDHGFKTRVSTWSRTYFPVVETEGDHRVIATISTANGFIAIAETSYHVEEAVEECEDGIGVSTEVEVKEDWLVCP